MFPFYSKNWNIILKYLNCSADVNSILNKYGQTHWVISKLLHQSNHWDTPCINFNEMEIGIELFQHTFHT